MKKRERISSHVAVFVAGFVTMALEVIGLSLVVPYFGAALTVQTNLIGIALISLAIGYFIGEKTGDSYATSVRLSRIFLAIALLLPFIFYFHAATAGTISKIINDISRSSFLTFAILFGPINILLGMVLPYAMKILTESFESVGKTSGKLYALSAFGSISGILLAGLWFLPAFGVSAVMQTLTVFSFGTAIAIMPIFLEYAPVALVGILLLSGTPLAYAEHSQQIFSDGKVIIDRDSMELLDDAVSIHSRIRAFAAKDKISEKPIHLLEVNGEIHSAVLLDSNELVFNYARYNRLGGHFNPAAKKALLIGGGGYSYANYFLSDTPLYDREKIWAFGGKYYHNNKTVTLPIRISNNEALRQEKPILVYENIPSTERAAIEGTQNKIFAENQAAEISLRIQEVSIKNTGFEKPAGYVHIHETREDGTPGAIISPDVPISTIPLRPRTLIGESSLISGFAQNITVPLTRSIKEGEIVFPMLHRDNGNGRLDLFLIDGYEQIENLDVVEIDPRTTEFASKYFNLNLLDPRLRIFHEDGRTYVNRVEEKYDIIYLDAFRSFYAVPWQLSTIEATQKIFDMLNEKGVLVANIPAALRGPYSKFFQAELATYRKIFPEVRVYAVISPHQEEAVQNIILVAFRSKDSIRKSPNDDQEINEQLTHEWKGTIESDTPILTDDFAPTDYYTGKFIHLHSF